MNESEIRARVEAVSGRPADRHFAVFHDTTQFTDILRGHVIELEGNHYLVQGDMREGRFGIDEQPKFWVKRAVELGTGAKKVLKLVFHEDFNIRIGLLRIRCYRDPEKEGRVLDLVRGDPRFMQGVTMRDEKGNAVRVIDLIRGKSIYRYLHDLDMGHEEYFRTALPGVLRGVLGCFEAIATIHAKGLHHGDIRNDHILIEKGTGLYRWIDFDLCQDVSDFDVWSLGNILLFSVGKGEHTFHEVRAGKLVLAKGAAPLTEQDASGFFVHRIMNLRKLFPWIPAALNDVLMHFSYGTADFYESVDEVIDDLRPVVRSLGADESVAAAGEST
jgi:hypothetical protein